MKVKATKFEGVFKIDGKLATVNLTPGYRVYGEKLVKVGGVEYRVWDKWRSKPAAAISKGLKVFPIEEGSKILYLGIASGTTASHFSDIVGRSGLIYGVEISATVLRELLPHAERRKNIVPILADCRKVDEYESLILEKVDCVYCDIADPQEVEVFVRNCERFLKKGGYGMVAIKSRSIDVIKSPREIYEESRRFVEERGFEIEDFVTLHPYQKDHGFMVVRK